MATRTKKAAGFWDTYQDEGGGKYLTAPEKNALIEGAVPLEIVAVRYDETNQFQGNAAPRYVVTFDVPAGLKNVKEGERFAGFALSSDGSPSSRDSLLGALDEYLGTAGAEKVVVVMKRDKQFVSLVKAD